MGSQLVIKLPNGTDIEAGGAESGLVRAGANQAVEAIRQIVGAADIAGAIGGFLQSLSSEIASRSDLGHESIKISFGVGVGGSAGFKLVSANASSFLNVEIVFKGTPSS